MMIYIMVTNWTDHWDRLKGNSTLYSVGMMRNGMDSSRIKDKTRTIFIKRNKESKDFERCWIGTTSDFKTRNYRGKESVCFRVEINEEMECPAKYLTFSEGWYFDLENPEYELKTEDTNLDPKFFIELQKTTDWLRFEKYAYWLLKCLGIHNSHRFGPNKQKGKADGFFRFGGFI